MSSVGNNNVAFWAARNADTSLDAVAAEIVVLLGRARFRDMTRVDIAVVGGGQRILGRGYSDGRW